MTSHFSSVVDLSLWLKFDRHTSYKTKFMQVYTLQGFDQKNTFFNITAWTQNRLKNQGGGGLWHLHHMQRNWPCIQIFLVSCQLFGAMVIFSI